MSRFDQTIATANDAALLRHKKQFLQYFLNVVQQSKGKLDAADKAALLDFTYGQIDAVAAAIPEAKCYKEKDQLFEMEDLALGIIMGLCPSPAAIPEEKLMKIQSLVKLVEEERKIETTLDGLFQQESVAETDINRLLFWVKQTNDEYQRSVMYPGILHYRGRLNILSQGAKAKLSEHLHSELRRLLALENIEGEPADALELLSDVIKLFPCAETPALLLEVLNLRRNQISFYAVWSLLELSQEVPQWAIDDLAGDLVHADLIFGILAQHGKTHLFPKALANDEYLAKSNLVHWLTYPTELGKAPDEIEYIGKITYLFKKDVYHVFKYRSDSDTLGDDLTNKWLIGWSSKDGGTFSNFDEFEKFDMGSTEKTLKNIKKKLIG